MQVNLGAATGGLHSEFWRVSAVGLIGLLWCRILTVVPTPLRYPRANGQVRLALALLLPSRARGGDYFSTLGIDF